MRARCESARDELGRSFVPSLRFWLSGGAAALALSLLSGCSSEEPPPVPDACKPAGAPPEVIVGRGEYNYLAMNDGDVIQVVAPPQGGHVIWLALRQTGLRQFGSTSTATGRVDELDLDVGPSPVAFSFLLDEDGYCKLYGLPLPIDETRKVTDLLGKEMKVSIEVADEDGDVGVGTRIVKLSDDIF